MKKKLRLFQPGELNVVSAFAVISAAVSHGWWPEELQGNGYFMASDLNKCVAYLLEHYPDQFMREDI